jgi:NAD(P)-dependent dehydrogenase (short-subunit alcohol dehydrogenase family)
MKLSAARHAFVTGGASGIGLGIVDALISSGLSVTVADFDRPTLDAVCAVRSRVLCGIALDTRDRVKWTEAKATAEAAFGPVDILVNNAGIGPDGRELADMDPLSFDQTIAIDLTGVFNGVSAFAADMRKRGSGHIVNTASVVGLTSGFAGLGAYTVAKFGVVALSEVLHKELAPHGVGVSVLCPGPVGTNLHSNTRKAGVGAPSATRGTNVPRMEPSTVGLTDVVDLHADTKFLAEFTFRSCVTLHALQVHVLTESMAKPVGPVRA